MLFSNPAAPRKLLILLGNLNVYLFVNTLLRKLIKMAQLSVLSRCRHQTYPYSRCRWCGRVLPRVVHPYDLLEPLIDNSKFVLLDLAVLSSFSCKVSLPQPRVYHSVEPFCISSISSKSIACCRFPVPVTCPPLSIQYLYRHLQNNRSPGIAHRRTLLVAFLIDFFDRRKKTWQRCSFHTCVHPSTPRAR